MSEPVKPTQKICPRCGRTFGCLHAEGCWCFGYTITPENTEKLRNTYNNCLCPECLPLYAEKKTEQPTGTQIEQFEIENPST